MSKSVSNCEQGVFNEIERIALSNFASASNKYGLSLKGIRVGERLVSGYLSGDLLVGGGKIPGQNLEITFEPGADIEGSSIASLGAVRYSVGDGNADSNGSSVWATTNSNGSIVRGYYTELLRNTFRTSVRQALGLDPLPGHSPAPTTPQTCWRGCSSESDERRYHDITILAKGVLSTRPTQVATESMKLSCVYYRPKGVEKYPLPHYESSGRFETSFQVGYEARLQPSAMELFTNSALTVLEGQITIANQTTQVLISSSYNAGQLIEGSLIPGFGGMWNPIVTGPDSTNFWEREYADFDFYKSLSVFHSEETGIYPREVHCFDPGKEPSYSYWENPVEYEKLNYRGRKSLTKNIQPLADKVQANIVSAFGFAVKIFAKQSKLSKEEFAAYYSGYFKEVFEKVKSDLAKSYAAASSIAGGFERSAAEFQPLLDESRKAIEAQKPKVQDLISLKDRLLKGSESACSGNFNQVSVSQENLSQNFDQFLEFKSDAGTIFAISDMTDEFERAFSGVTPTIDTVEKLLESLDQLLESGGSCQSLAKAFAGVVLKLDSLALAGDQDTIEQISATALAALKRAAATKELSATEMKLVAQLEKLGMDYNTGTSNLSYSQATDAVRETKKFTDQEVRIAVDSMKVADQNQRNGLLDKFKKRSAQLDSELMQFLQDAGGPESLIAMRLNFTYDPLIGQVIAALSLESDATKKAFMASWVKQFLDAGWELPAACLDPKIAIASKDTCWTIPIPQAGASAESIIAVDRNVTRILNKMTVALKDFGG